MLINTTYFDFSRWRSSDILDFLKLEISTAGPVRRANMRHHAKCWADRSNLCQYIVTFRMSAAAILDIFTF